MRLITLARTGLAIGLAGLGVLSLVNADFAMNWQPVPDGIPLRTFLAYVSGGILLSGGIGLLIPRTARLAAIGLTLFVTLWLVLLQMPRVAAHPADLGVWLGFGENLLLVAGSWVLCIALIRAGSVGGGGFFASETGLRAARLLFGLALVIIGPSHFKYASFTAAMVPSWVPAHLFFAYLTGAGHIAAGVGILLGIVPRLAATMEAAMISCFVLLLHLPGMVGAPGNRLQWTMLCVAVAYASAAWAVAASYAPPVPQVSAASPADSARVATSES